MQYEENQIPEGAQDSAIVLGSPPVIWPTWSMLLNIQHPVARWVDASHGGDGPGYGQAMKGVRKVCVCVCACMFGVVFDSLSKKLYSH